MSMKEFLKAISEIPLLNRAQMKVNQETAGTLDQGSRDKYVKAYESVKKKNDKKSGKKSENVFTDEKGFNEKEYKSYLNKFTNIVSSNKRNLANTNIILTLGEYTEGKRDLFKDSDLPSFYETGSNFSVLNNKYVHFNIDRNAVNFDIDKTIFTLDKNQDVKNSSYAAVIKSIHTLGENKSISGIVIRVPISMFKAVDEKRHEARKEKIKALAQNYYNILNLTFKSFLFKIPVFVVVTELEEIFGFDDFLSFINKEERNQYFGWSNPYDVELPYSEDVSAHFADSFRNTIDNFVANKMIENADPERMKNVFLFKNDLFTYMSEVKIFVDFLFGHNEFFEYSSLRGVYLCGYENAGTPVSPLGEEIHSGFFRKNEEEEEEKDTAVLQKPSMAAAAQNLPAPVEPRRLAFFSELYTKKITKELSLNLPTKELLSNNRKHRVISVLLLAGTVCAIPFLYYNFNNALKGSYDRLSQSLLDLEPSIKKTVERFSTDSLSTKIDLTDLVEVYDTVKDRKNTHISTIYSPLTMLSGIDGKINHFLNGAVVLFGVTPAYNLLQNRITDLSTVGINKNAIYGVEDSYNLFEGYIRNVNELQRNLKVYNAFQNAIDVDALDGLLQYLIGTDLSDFFRRENFVLKNIRGEYRIRSINSDLLVPKFTDKYEILLTNLLHAISGETVMRDNSKEIISFVDTPGLNIQDNDNYGFLKRLSADLEDTRKNLEVYSSSVQVLTSTGKEIKLDKDTLMLNENNLIVSKSQVDVDKFLKQAISKRNQNLLQYVSTVLGSLYAFKDKDAPPRLAEKFGDLDTLLNGLGNTDFFFANRFTQNSEKMELIENDFDWNKVNVPKILDEMGAYQKYLNDNLSKYPGTLQPVISAVSLSGMANLIVDQINSDTIQSTIKMSDNIDKEVRIFNGKKDGIIKILQFLSTTNANNIYTELVNLTLERSVYYLSYYKKVLDDTVHYKPRGNTFDWWDGANPPAFDAYNVYGQTELADYVDKQNSKVGTLLSDYTQALVDLVNALVLHTTYQDNGFYTTWKQISEEFAAKDKNGSLQVLDDFILKTLTTVDGTSCLNGFDDVDKEAFKNNYFSQITKDIASALKRQCQFIYENKVAYNYNKVVAVFNDKIAGKFPFSNDFSSDTSEELEESDIRDFVTLFRSYFPDDSFIDKIKTFHLKNWELPLVFLQRMMNVSKFMWPLIGDSKSPPKDQFYLVVDFNRSKENERNTSSLLERKLYVSSNFITNLGQGQNIVWSPSESASFTFHWAKDGTQIPVALTGPTTSKFNSDAKGYTISLTANDKWSLLYLLEKYSRTKDEFFYSPELFFKIPVKRIINLKKNFIIANSNFAHVGIKVQFYDGNKSELLNLPVFPTDASPMKIDPLFAKM